jgi:hypothetical protein
MAQAAKTLVPFDEGAKWRIGHPSLIGSVDYAAGQTKSLPLRKYGLVSGLLVHITADMTGSSAVLNEEGLFSLIESLQVNIGISSANPVDLSGAALRDIQSLDHFGFSPDRGCVGATTPNPLFYSAPVANSVTNKWVFSFYVPIAMNSHKERHLGILPMFAKGFRADLVIRWASLASMVASGSITAITNLVCQVEQHFFEMPDFRTVAPPNFFVVKRVSTRQGKLLAGDNLVDIPQEGQMLALMHTLRINGLRSDAILSHRLRVDGNDTFRHETLRGNRFRNRRSLGLDMNTGVVLQNFLDSEGEPFTGSARDTIDTGNIAAFESIIEVDPTVSLAANPSLNTIETMRILLQPIAVDMTPNE